jgi:hypothetical protein
METCFAPPEKAHGEDLRRQVQMAAENPVINGVIRSAGGLLAVLNENRQIVSLNYSMLDLLGVDQPETLFGLRPGEAVGCRYANEMPAGCGTSEYCINCGAAVAIVACLQGEGPIERTCAISIDRDGKTTDFFFRVIASSIRFDEERFILLFLQDITQDQNRAALERVFFHDINNIIMGLLNAAELLASGGPAERTTIVEHVVGLSKRLSREVEFQQTLLKNGSVPPALQFDDLPVDFILEEAWKTSSCHPAAKGKSCQIQNSAPDCLLNTDPASLTRVLGNMLINALEAAETSRIIRFDAYASGGYITFNVWNAESIPDSVACRVFQRNFSTKREFGRGLGTYSMKLIGEKLLNGRVYFRSSPTDGTTFSIALPINR